MRGGLLVILGVAGLAALALALVLFEMPGEDAIAARVDTAATRLPAFLVASSPEPCATCHYAWDEPYAVEAERSARGADGLATYRIRLAPWRADYFLWDVRAAPRVPGEEAPPAESGVARPIAPALGQTVPVPWRVGGNLTSLAVRVLADDPFARPQLSARVIGPDGAAWDLEGARGHKFLAIRAPAPGDYRVEVTYVDGGTPTAPARVIFSETRSGWALAPRVPLGEAAAFEWRLPAPSEPGAPEGFVLRLRAFNAHPSDKWRLPATNDDADYALFVPAAPAGPPAPARAWTPAEIDAAWAGARSVTIHEERVDVTRIVTRNARGEWGGRAHYFEEPPEEAAFPAIPPGTRFLRAELTVTPRTPLSPVPDFYFTTSRRPDPSFHYPESTVVKPDGWVVVLPVKEEEWEDPSRTGWFQGFARLTLNEQGVAAFDGAYAFKIEALVDAPPEWTGT